MKKRSKKFVRPSIQDQLAKLKKSGLPAFERPPLSVALCATVYVPVKDGPEYGEVNIPNKGTVKIHKKKELDLNYHIDEIHEGEIVIAPWIDAKHGPPAILELYGREADTICVMRKEDKVAICGFKEGM